MRVKLSVAFARRVTLAAHRDVFYQILSPRHFTTLCLRGPLDVLSVGTDCKEKCGKGNCAVVMTARGRISRLRIKSIHIQ